MESLENYYGYRSNVGQGHRRSVHAEEADPDRTVVLESRHSDHSDYVGSYVHDGAGHGQANVIVLDNQRHYVVAVIVVVVILRYGGEGDVAVSVVDLYVLVDVEGSSGATQTIFAAGTAGAFDTLLTLDTLDATGASGTGNTGNTLSTVLTVEASGTLLTAGTLNTSGTTVTLLTAGTLSTSGTLGTGNARLTLLTLDTLLTL